MENNRTAADRLRQDNVFFTIAGENLAFAYSVEQAHDGLMESPGHRANILAGMYSRVGIGIIDAGLFGLMITQTFTG